MEPHPRAFWKWRECSLVPGQAKWRQEKGHCWHSIRKTWNAVRCGILSFQAPDQTDSLFLKEVYTDYENCLSKTRTVKVSNVPPLLQNSEAHITFLDKKSRKLNIKNHTVCLGEEKKKPLHYSMNFHLSWLKTQLLRWMAHGGNTLLHLVWIKWPKSNRKCT